MMGLITLRVREVETRAIVARNALAIQTETHAEAQRIHDRKLEVLGIEHRMRLEVSRAEALNADAETMTALAAQSEQADVELLAGKQDSLMKGLKYGSIAGGLGGLAVGLVVGSALVMGW